MIDEVALQKFKRDHAVPEDADVPLYEFLPPATRALVRWVWYDWDCRAEALLDEIPDELAIEVQDQPFDVAAELMLEWRRIEIGEQDYAVDQAIFYGLTLEGASEKVLLACLDRLITPRTGGKTMERATPRERLTAALDLMAAWIEKSEADLGVPSLLLHTAEGTTGARPLKKYRRDGNLDTEKYLRDLGKPDIDRHEHRRILSNYLKALKKQNRPDKEKLASKVPDIFEGARAKRPGGANPADESLDDAEPMVMTVGRTTYSEDKEERAKAVDADKGQKARVKTEAAEDEKKGGKERHTDAVLDSFRATGIQRTQNEHTKEKSGEKSLYSKRELSWLARSQTGPLFCVVMPRLEILMAERLHPVARFYTKTPWRDESRTWIRYTREPIDPEVGTKGAPVSIRTWNLICQVLDDEDKPEVKKLIGDALNDGKLLEAKRQLDKEVSPEALLKAVKADAKANAGGEVAEEVGAAKTIARATKEARAEVVHGELVIVKTGARPRREEDPTMDALPSTVRLDRSRQAQAGELPDSLCRVLDTPESLLSNCQDLEEGREKKIQELTERYGKARDLQDAKDEELMIELMAETGLGSRAACIKGELPLRTSVRAEKRKRDYQKRAREAPEKVLNKAPDIPAT